MVDAMSHAGRHPLDIDLADFCGDLVDEARREALEDHLGGCLLCRIKVRRLRDALGEPPDARYPAPSGADVSAGIRAGLSVTAPRVSVADVSTGRLAPGQLWAAGSEERLLVLVVREGNGRVLVVPVTFDVPGADDETVVVEAALSPFEVAIAVYPALPAELPRFALVACFGQLVEPGDVDQLLAGALPRTARGEPIDGPTDPRLEFRQMLADQLGALEGTGPGPGIAADAPPAGPERLAAVLAEELAGRRGQRCRLYRLSSWEGLVLAYSKGWTPVAAVDELGTVLVVFDTLSGLASGDDFNAAVSVLTRYNATAVVVLATSLGPDAELFDAASLSYGIGVPSGEGRPPAPLLSGLAAADAIAKFLDQSSAWSQGSWPGRASTAPSDVIATLSRSAASAIEEVVSQGRRAKIAPKAAGYASVELLARDLEDVLRGALAGDQVAQRLSDLASRSKR
jgi:hypothetical protein